MARITYEDEFLTEYDDGTEEVRFSEAEWEVMLADPAFGYVCQARKHRLQERDHQFIAVEGICPGCYADAEAMDAIYEGAYEEAVEGGATDEEARAIANAAVDAEMAS